MSVLTAEELAQYIAKDSRRKFINVVSRVAGAGSIAMLAAGQTGTGTGAGTSTPSAANDLNILNYALTLEFLEATFIHSFWGRAPCRPAFLRSPG